jgi:RNA polymerase sigma-70 factor, ECF subfamily
MTSPARQHAVHADDAALWRRLCEGDEQAFVALYRGRSGPLLRFAERLTGSRALAEDVLQEVFLAVIDASAGRSSAGYDPARGSLASYLFGVARNAAHKRLRSAAPERATATEPPGRRSDDDEQAVRGALARLDPVFREVVLLCDLEGLRYDEAAAALAVPVGTVRSRLARGRARLAALLADEAPAKPSAVMKEAR